MVYCQQERQHSFVDTTKKTIEVFCNSQPAPLDSAVRQRLHAALRNHLQRKQ